MNSKKQLKVIDLFCGIGGLSHGLIKEGFDVVAGIDNDNTCRFGYEYNNKAKFIHKDILKVSAQEIDQLFGEKEETVRVLVGCAPCQPFSTLNIKQIAENQLEPLEKFACLVRETLPDVVFMENVSGLANTEKYPIFKTLVNGSDYVGGVIDNSALDEAITEDLIPQEYPLENYEKNIFSQYTSDHEHGTIIRFENIKDGIRNTEDFLKRIMALYFRFSLLDDSFNIFINEEKITLDHLERLAQKTQFLWNINNLNDPYISEKLTDFLKEEAESIQTDSSVKGFIASVDKPKSLKILTIDDRVGIDLFVNGRLRERDILKHIPTARLAENYFYGQIHFDNLDDEKDRFTSSREGIIADDPKYKRLSENYIFHLIRLSSKWIMAI